MALAFASFAARSLHAHILPKESAESLDELVNIMLNAWMLYMSAKPPRGSTAHQQKELDGHLILRF